MDNKKIIMILTFLISVTMSSWASQTPTTPNAIQPPAPIPAPQNPQPPQGGEVSQHPEAAPAPHPETQPPSSVQVPSTEPSTKAPSPPLQAHNPSGTDHKAEAFVLSCADFRLNDDVVRSLEKEGLKEKYDLIVIPGGTLSATNDFFPSWKETFWSSMGILNNLHKFGRVILIDHRDCGAYKMIYGRDLSQSPEEEKSIHMSHSQKLKRLIKKKYPHLLDGSYEKTDIDQ